jgi:peptide/nickel transport system ATP-binding protein
MEGVIEHQNTDTKEARKAAIDALHRVGMPEPGKTIDRYPHQLSGGMRQRAMIAMALACSPELLIADEPTTALDVTTEAQILELLETLKETMGMTIMYITHNLGVIAEMAEDVIVMYLGQIVEKSDVVTLFTDPKHPYTRALIGSIPKLGSRGAKGKLAAIRGMVPSPYNMPTGCRFHPRCDAFILGVCDVAVPPEVSLGDEQSVKCFLYTDKHEKVGVDG